jgi:N-acetylglucosamine-6-phosphate deacetylase
MVTLSPHFADSENYIRALRVQRVRVSLGHTHASAEQLHTAVCAGASFSTHLGNGIAFHIERHHNPLWSQLAEPRLTAMFIADGYHLPADTLKAMLHAKTIRRSILVSDTVALAGMPPGRYTAPIGGKVELSVEGCVNIVGSSILAGAARPLIDCLGTAMRFTGLPLHRVLQMATLNPGRAARHGGSLAPGKRADLLQFKWDAEHFALRVQAVWLAGEQVYSAS